MYLEHGRTVSLPAPPRKARRAVTFGKLGRAVCVLVAVGAIVLLGWRLGVGIGRVSRGEITGAQMLSELGAWLRGGAPEQKLPDEPKDDWMQPPTEPAPDGAESSADGDVSKPSKEQDLYTFDRSLVPAGARAIVPKDLFDVNAVSGGDSSLWQAPAAEITQGPLVLIVHSHGGEGYTPEGTVYLDGDAIVGRSDVAVHSVIGAGKALCEALNERGIGAIHCPTRFDQTGNAGAFERTAKAISAYLEQYPTIRYVIDVHRGAGLDENGDIVRAVTWHDGAATAQSAWIAPQGSASEALATALCEQMNADGGRLCYSVQAEHFGQAWAWENIYTLRAEIGTSGNSAEEATRAAEYIAHALRVLLR